jgi:hypothetical protein
MISISGNCGQLPTDLPTRCSSWLNALHFQDLMGIRRTGGVLMPRLGTNACPE